MSGLLAEEPTAGPRPGGHRRAHQAHLQPTSTVRASGAQSGPLRARPAGSPCWLWTARLPAARRSTLTIRFHPKHRGDLPGDRRDTGVAGPRVVPALVLAHSNGSELALRMAARPAGAICWNGILRDRSAPRDTAATILASASENIPPDCANCSGSRPTWPCRCRTRCGQYVTRYASFSYVLLRTRCDTRLEVQVSRLPGQFAQSSGDVLPGGAGRDRRGGILLADRSRIPAPADRARGRGQPSQCGCCRWSAPVRRRRHLVPRPRHRVPIAR